MPSKPEPVRCSTGDTLRIDAGCRHCEIAASDIFTANTMMYLAARDGESLAIKEVAGEFVATLQMPFKSAISEGRGLTPWEAIANLQMDWFSDKDKLPKEIIYGDMQELAAAVASLRRKRQSPLADLAKLVKDCET